MKTPCYQGEYSDYPVSDLLSTEVLSLPIWPELELEKIEVVVGVIDRAIS
ncbi:DegT/DnrJ/EryC1/StrS family aminotransferase [Cylindrospermopsis raciborskii]|nr:DegT/DnrJ/EryC1/StrS family aminotransferase [Cylindrospermopsis raciborskii]